MPFSPHNAPCCICWPCGVFYCVLLYFDYTMSRGRMERNLQESSGKIPHYSAKSPRTVVWHRAGGFALVQALLPDRLFDHQRYCHCQPGLRRQHRRFRGWLPPRLPALPCHRQRRSGVSAHFIHNACCAGAAQVAQGIVLGVLASLPPKLHWMLVPSDAIRVTMALGVSRPYTASACGSVTLHWFSDRRWCSPSF